MRLDVDKDWTGAALPEPWAAVTLTAAEGGLLLRIDARFAGDPPPPGPPGPTWALWEHEVVEFFLLGADDRYLEVEVGPYGHHLVLLLRGRRVIVDRLLPLALTFGQDGARWWAEALLPAPWIPTGPHRANAYAIAGAPRRHMAASPVPGDAPDFHRLEAFPSVLLPSPP